MDFRLRSDSSQWIIERRHVHGEDSKTPGKEEWRPDGYYPSLEVAAKTLLDKVTRERYKTGSIDDLVHTVEQATEDVIREVYCVTEVPA